MYIIIGLGNPGEKYKNTRHNAGRMAAELIEKSGQVSAKFITPDTFMNKTGAFVAKYVKSKKVAEKLVVIYDDLDLPLGAFKVAFNRGSGGHRGLDSIIRALKTREFTRIRIGIASTTPSGKIKKPKGDVAVEKFILSDFRKPETEILKKVLKKVAEAAAVICEDGREVAMNKYN